MKKWLVIKVESGSDLIETAAVCDSSEEAEKRARGILECWLLDKEEFIADDCGWYSDWNELWAQAPDDSCICLALKEVDIF